VNFAVALCGTTVVIAILTCEVENKFSDVNNIQFFLIHKTIELVLITSYSAE